MDGIQPQPRLRDQVRAVIRVNRYSIRTEKSYWYWICFYIRFHQMKHPKDMGPKGLSVVRRQLG
ncbi:phage integrase N-terminal SAM-like domain-containing protein [Marinobacter sp. 2_MG-2023]|uniref:phage integrase N-terminal SAM-like domain-containing protein n=1 Tax=Marinobacter sp. 2_MG-2023 TaxID=3062679 RepID=UPI0026E284B0|nr:phage integrase N-terminal SAM-like domain-containing protein [Marinobacter sp. 2_MG-2023]MDO6441711.1 phage integrase N-terminal SAM-like domain-containing protein [Marinobacter sp. 2_MG-2023]